MEAKAILALTKGIDKGARKVHAVASTGSLDRDREIIAPGAFEKSLSVFRSNPVLMASHTYKSSDARPTVIGSVVDIKTTDDGVTFEAEFAGTPLADEYWQLYRDGHMRAFSVGFIPGEKIRRRDFTDEQKEAWGDAEAVHTEAELVEISAVAVPSNRDALVQASAKGLQVAEQLKQQLDDSRLATCGDLTELREDVLSQLAIAIGDLKDTITTAVAVKMDDEQGEVPADTVTEAGEAADSKEQCVDWQQIRHYIDENLEL